MERPDRDSLDGQHSTDDGTASGFQSVELDKVRRELSIKVEKHGAHYSDIEPLGKGSFGEVHSGRDALLGRQVAIKSLKREYRDADDVVHRFLKEARGTAQLEHPNIMPVHEIGMSDEFGIYFTMKKIEGEDLKEILDKLQANTSFYEKTYTLNFLLEVFLSVCNGVAYAHSKGIIHRDLKPANIMVGQYGEVLILDWGLVKQVVSESGEASDDVQLRMDESDAGLGTLDGSISGTPNYMPPEQADGRINDVSFQSDVYSLGAILYHILTYYPPFEKDQIRRLLQRVKEGDFTPPRKRFPDRGIPRELEAICLKAMSKLPMRRYHTVEHLAQDVRNYIGNFEVKAYRAPRWVRFWKACKRNPVKTGMAAAAVVAAIMAFGAQRAMLYGSYRSNVEDAVEFQQKGNAAVDEATDLCNQLKALDARSERKELSVEEVALQQQFEEKSRNAAANFNISEMLFDNVPVVYRNRDAVRNGYIGIMRRRIEFALFCRQYDRAQGWLDTIRLRMEQLGIGSTEETGSQLNTLQARINGKSSLEITGPDNIPNVMVWPLLEDDETPRMHLGDAIKRGPLPLTVKALHKGSYILQVTRSDGTLMPYPVFIGHGEHKRVELEIPERLYDDLAYVPGGKFISGGKDSRFYRERQYSLPAFYIKKHEVTVAEYLEFWKSLKDPDQKTAYMSLIRFHPRERRYKDAWDEEGRLSDERLKPEYPVVGISLEAAEAFCEWKSRQTGQTIRLPTAEEWEKAARGVDGRKYVWGNGYSAAANLTLTKGNEKGKARFPLWAPPGSFPRDITVYGAYDMAGNVREMTSTPLPNSDQFYQFKGGSASTPENFLPCSYSSDTAVVPSDVGFRYLQEVPKI